MNKKALGRLFKGVEDEEGNRMFDWGATVPTDDDENYAVGCLFIHTDNTDNTDILYINIGTAAACNFNAVTVAAD